MMTKKIPDLYHISQSNKLPSYLYPRHPSGLKNADNIDEPVPNTIFTEKTKPRVCFSPSIEHCWKAIYPNLHKEFGIYGKPHIDFYVYKLIKGDPINMDNPDDLTKGRKVWDAHYTLEHCFYTKVRIKLIAKVRIMKPTNDEIDKIKPYNEGDKEYNGAPDVEIKVLKVFDDSEVLKL